MSRMTWIICSRFFANVTKAIEDTVEFWLNDLAYSCFPIISVVDSTTLYKTNKAYAFSGDGSGRA